MGGSPPLGSPRIRLGPAGSRSLGDARRRRDRTTSLLVGTNVTPVPRRRPHVLAHQVATLDVLSGGRVVFGAGIGGIESEFTAFGEDADARTRAEELDEGLEVLRRLWSGERVDHHGRHYTVDGVTLAPRPARSGCRSGSEGTARARSAGQPDSTAGPPTRRTRRA